MKLSGEQILPCDLERAWELLLHPEVLEACIPGCESLTRHTPESFSAVVAIKVGPVKARFTGDVALSDLKPPLSCRISGKGAGGIAGFAEGGATMSLAPTPEGTRLTYDVDAQVGGKLAQLGARLIDSTAKKLAQEFFSRLEAKITELA